MTAVAGKFGKATTVHSTAKFPAPKDLPPPHTMFSASPNLPPPHPEADHDIFYSPAEEAKSACVNAELAEDLYTIFGVLNLVGSGKTFHFTSLHFTSYHFISLHFVFTSFYFRAFTRGISYGGGGI